MEAPELLLPAGSLEVLKIAVLYGADAVYIGGEAYGLRAKARNFTPGEMREGIAFAHEHGAKVYVTANIFAHNADLPGIREYFTELREIAPDALIISDPGVFLLSRETCPEIGIHISTQAGSANYETLRFWQAQGASRVVAARELSLDELKQMREEAPPDMEIEAFVHGAMCISYSGRCLLSDYFTGRDANRGACTHPCRWKYVVAEETRPGEYLPIYEDERGPQIFASKDLCMIGHMPELLSTSIDSMKVEGRMKTALYVATVARAYRKAIQACMESEEAYRDILPWCEEQVMACTYRPFTTGFYFGRPDANDIVYDGDAYRKGYTFLGIAGEDRGDGLVSIIQKNKFCVGDEIEIMRPDGGDSVATVRRILDADGHAMPDAPHAAQELYVDLGVQVKQYDILRKREYCGA